MLGVSRSPQALTSLALILLVGGVVGCAGGEGSTSGSPFTASGVLAMVLSSFSAAKLS